LLTDKTGVRFICSRCRDALLSARQIRSDVRVAVIFAALGLGAGGTIVAGLTEQASARQSVRAPAWVAHRERVRHHRRLMERERATVAAARHLVFGIYPGGASGAVGPAGPPTPENPAKRLAALERLRVTGRPFVVHLYAGYTGPGGWSVEQQVGEEIAQYEAPGLEIELVLAYRPSDGGTMTDIAGFTDFVRAAVHALGANPRFVSLQVANEANVGGAPNASDGYYRHAQDALISGVIAAKNEARRDGFGQVKVGFNWAWSAGATQLAFWKYLGDHGGSAFRGALDWVGLDAYPGTWGPAIASDLRSGIADGIRGGLWALRRLYLPLAGIPNHVPLHISENGYPTGPGRTETMQLTALRAAVEAVNAARVEYNVSDYRWFDLRDANSSSSSFEDHYGLMTDEYSPKPAFASYRELIASLG
jgi:hypothetical protein